MKSPDLRVIIPLEHDPRIQDYCIEVFREHLPGSSLSASFLPQAVSSTVSDYDQARNAPFILKTVQAAIRDNVDGVFIDVAFDTALSAAKSLGTRVVGALEAAVAHARTLCRQFSILAISREEIPVNFRLSREYGFTDLLRSVEPIEIGVLELRADPALTLARLTAAGEQAIASGAQAVILGCTAMGWAAPLLAERLPVPVIDTNLAGLYMLDSQVRLGLKPSRLEFQPPSGIAPLDDGEYEAIRRITFSLR